VTPNLPQWVSDGLQKLYRYQHTDGGWNWWEDDQTDGDMTAYVLWGLVQAKNAGFLVDDLRIARGANELVSLLSDEREWNRRVEWLMTLAFVKPAVAALPLDDAFRHRDRLDTYGLASLAIGLAQLGGSHLREAKLAAADLSRSAQVRGAIEFWPADIGGYSWRNDDVAVTAHVMRALLTAGFNMPALSGAARWLMAQRTGKAWDTTRDSAEAVLALDQYMERTKELTPDYTAQVMLDGKVVKELRATTQTALQPAVKVTLSSAELKGRLSATVEKIGTGTLYINWMVSYTIPSTRATTISRGIGADRRFDIEIPDPSRADSLSSGTDFQVQVNLTADANYKYVMVVDPIPAGCEVLPLTDGSQPAVLFAQGAEGYVREEVRDDSVVFFFDDLPKGRTTLSYALHSETPGLYRILPTTASLVYFPEIRGSGLPVRARIIDR
ncbi:MAG TPA: hypothetical protein VGS41_19115, partial [Chthonomonadales bacterium]|nr:hypothetical protein [Chthonomonadales bacterium]